VAEWSIAAVLKTVEV